MKRMQIVVALAAMTAGMGIGTILDTPAVAQQQAAPHMTGGGRYQIAAFSGVTGGSVFHGCYEVDTATGELWLVVPGQPVTKLSNGPQR